jgi:hypothetical protein
VSGDVLPTVLGILLVAGAAVFALLPLARKTRQGSEVPDGGAADRFAMYRQVLELEFDYQLGKVSAEDYASLSAEFLANAGAAFRLERVNLGDVDQEIEREIAAARAAFAAARTSTSPKVGTRQ